MSDVKFPDSFKKKRTRVPVIMQLEALECGAAALAMVMAYYGKWIPLEQVRRDCGVSRNGSNAKNMMIAARGYGFEAQGFRCETENLADSITLPCIIHWNLNHFVVLTGISTKYAWINDPAKGDLRVSIDELDQAFTGVCIELKPGPDFKQSGKPKSVLSFAKSRLKGAAPAVVFVMLSSLTGYLFGVINPTFVRFFLDRLLTGENPELLYPFLTLMLVCGIAQIAASWIQAVYALKINGKMAAVGNSEYMWKLLRLPMDFFSQRLSGDLLQRQSANASIATTLVDMLAPLLLNMVMMIVYLVLMLRNQMVETIKASGAESGYFQRWSGFQASVNRQNTRFGKLSRYLRILPTALSSIATALVMILGVLLAMRGKFSLGTILMFQGFLGSFMAPAQTIITVGQRLQVMHTEMERIEDVLKYPLDPVFAAPAKQEGKSYEKLSGEVELKNVTFGYSRLGEPLIRDFSIHIKPGSRVALVGASGCGKSTLSRLISGLYQPWSGEVLFDGQPINRIDRNVFTGSLAVVDQEIVLFEGTIEDNIKMWNKSIEDFEMILAARDARIYDAIMAREGGFYGSLTENGKDLSGGQRQRLEIARALAQDPTILILDEATSALDAKTEFELVNAVKARGITCIVIAHRLSTIRDCDEIVVLDHGVVTERGTHEELISRGGDYASLIASD